MRVLALADEPPHVPVKRMVADNEPDAIVLLGDLDDEVIADASDLDLPVLGVLGNHDPPGRLTELGIEDVHLRRVEAGGLSFAGFEGCVRFGRGGPQQYTQKQAERLARKLPPADVLLAHCPPWGVNDEPDDPAHVGFRALRAWVERHEPRVLLHGHTTPDPRTRVQRLGATAVIWVRGARTVEL
jgi:Icc-related predicted phosphoesterase